MTEQFDILSQNTESTVVSHYERPSSVRDTAYQTEAELEEEFIAQLTRQGFERLHIHSEQELIDNLRRQLERLNGYRFTDGEWQRLLKNEIANAARGIEDKAFTIQQDCVKTLTLDDGTIRNIRLLDKRDIHANSTQVINQYESTSSTPTSAPRTHRYDVTILVNGLPLVHIELKRRGVLLKEAFNQINRYGRESFWAGSALFEYVQIFIISNGTETKYYSNTTRQGVVRENSGTTKGNKTRTCNSFEFTSYWSDAHNKILSDIEDFTATFLSRHTLLSILTRYCVLTEQRVLMAMRPYQIAATERVLNRIEVAHNARQYGTVKAGGYVWHTTGSGKTLTSFKAAQLATRLDYIDKVLFVVDRKDLDYQTMKEYDRFQKGAANGNTSTRELERQIANPKSKIIITTIQKLSTFVKKNPQSDFYQREVVMIFDECHRSQFGQMHQLIVRRFKRYYLFGFTGTPIFAENVSAARGIYHTTQDVFGTRLHTYTIVDAIRDHNVLPFRVDYVRTMKEKDDIEDASVWDIEREKALEDPRRIAGVAKYIVEHFDQQTKQGRAYTHSLLANVAEIAADRRKRVDEQRVKTRISGFNSILAVQNIHCAKLYYMELQRQMAALPANRRLKIATIFSYGANEQDPDDGDENSDDTEGLDATSRDFLERAIGDYNTTFGTSYDTSADKFANYYKDVSLRMKNREIDLLIVVGMFLTGFDATTLNTLWVDKNLRYHGLLQAFSRTNRILNSIKTFGNVVCFRNLEDATNRCIALFGDAEARSVTILRPFDDYFSGYTDDDGREVRGYSSYIDELQATWQPGQLPLGEDSEKAFIHLFGTILKLRNLLSSFDQFEAADPLSERDLQDYTSIYLDLADKYRREGREKTDITDDVIFELELVKQVEVGIDYILFLVAQYRDSHQTDVEMLVKINKSIDASPDLRDKKELIEQFIASISPTGDIDDEWRQYVNDQKREQFAQIVSEEHLRPEPARTFIADAFERGYVPEGGMELDGIMPPINPFDRAANRQGKIQQVLSRLKSFFLKFADIANAEF